MTDAVELTLGSQVWFDGDVWTITEFGRGSVTLSSGQSIRTATIAMFARFAQPIVEPSVNGHVVLPTDGQEISSLVAMKTPHGRTRDLPGLFSWAVAPPPCRWWLERAGTIDLR